MDLLKHCTLCPRECKVNRYEKVGVCSASSNVRVAHYCLHAWEEPIISGTNGSGAVFFSFCNLKCIFCQNYKISSLGYGKEITTTQLENIFLTLQKQGAHNINLVSPTHYVPQIVSLLQNIKGKTLFIPVVYNTNSYENISTIQSLHSLIDIYLADLKYFDSSLGERYSHCKNYFEVATKAIAEMFLQVGKFVIKDGLMKSGLIVRVLVLPGHVEDAKKIIAYLYETYHDDIWISIMNQYTPMKEFSLYPNLNRPLTEKEYQEVVDFAIDLGVQNAFIQEGDTAKESFIPEFNCNLF